MKQAYVKATGKRIVASCELVPALNHIEGFDQHGQPEPDSSGFELDWNGTRHDTNSDGKRLFQCEDGRRWLLQECVFRSDEQAPGLHQALKEYRKVLLETAMGDLALRQAALPSDAEALKSVMVARNKVLALAREVSADQLTAELMACNFLGEPR